MEIIVCIKQVPDTTEVKINPETNTLIREGVPSIVNPFDENAVEDALQLKEKHGGKVTVITMGPPQATEALEDDDRHGRGRGFPRLRPGFCRIGHLGNLLHPFPGHQKAR